MAKKKIKSKPVRKYKKAHNIKVKNLNLSLKHLLISLVFIGILFLCLIKILNLVKINHPSYIKQLANKTYDLKKENLTTVYLSTTPQSTPTPVPLSGFCIHVPILMYHHIQPESSAKQLGQTSLTVDSLIFDKQMQYLAENDYTSYFANELANALISHQNLPDKSVVITMDDGYEDNYIYALPVLQKYGLKANIMLASGLMNNSNMLSWDEVKSLRSSRLIYFTNHTWSHHAINQESEVKVSYEIDTGKSVIESQTGQTVNIFTYPFGALNNNAVSALVKKGYVAAFSEIPGTYQCDSFLMTLHRTRVGNAPLSSYGL